MANLHDYIHWRGDLKMDAVPFCEADALLLAQFSYVAFGDLLPEASGFTGSVTIGEAAKALCAYDPDALAIHQTFYMWRDNKRMLNALKNAQRFSALRILGYRDELTEDVQFAALCVPVGEKLTAVCFRGTDDSAAGWKEDFFMSTSDPVPAQLKAAQFLSEAAQALSGNFIVLGHSKGGNLAVYAAAQAPESVQDRITKVINLDGPGFPQDFLASGGFRRIQEKTVQYLPEGSIVGRLLYHGENRVVIKSQGLGGVMQHSAFSWLIGRDTFLRGKKLSASSEVFNAAMTAWLNTLSDEDRRRVTNRLFGVLSGLDPRTLDSVRAVLMNRNPGGRKTLPHEEN